MQVAKNKVVEIDFTLKDDQGEILDQSEENQPLAYLHGTGSIISGLECALDGKVAGDQVAVTVSPTEGYGEQDDTLRQEIPREAFDEAGELSPGMQFRVPTDAGDRVITVIEIEEQIVKVDGNHPLAGETLHFDVTISNVRDATDEEIAHGHVHGPGGHHHE